MPAFMKNPKFIIGAIIALWLIALLYDNFQLEPIQIKLLPFFSFATLQIKVSAVIIGSIVVGALLTLTCQRTWRRWRSAKNGSQSPQAS
jgi:uncharacterized integral membrane protein